MDTPIITIFVRHTPRCKWAGEEFHKGCNCRKHFRWSQGGKQYRKQAGTRTGAEAEENKRRLEAQLSGQPVPEAKAGRTLGQSVEVFNADKRNQGWTIDVLGKYARELARLQGYCEGKGVFTVQGITRELLVGYQATWPDLYSSTQTRQAVQSRLRNFLRFRDAVTLRRDEIIHEKKLTRIVTKRQKTGTHVSVPIPPDVAKEIVSVANGNPVYIFWNTGSGKAQSAVTNWQHDLRKLFRDAGITSAGNRLSHRLRDTFAVDLLQKGRQDRLDSLVCGTWVLAFDNGPLFSHSSRARWIIPNQSSAPRLK